MNTMTKFIFAALSLVTLLCVHSPALAAFKAGRAGGEDGGEGCLTEAKAQQARKAYEQVLADDKAGRTKQAYDGVRRVNTACIVGGSPTGRYGPEEDRLAAIRRKSGGKLGEEAENKGRLAEAHKYFVENHHRIASDRVEMKMATARPDDFETVSKAIYGFRRTQEELNRLDMNELRKINPNDHDAIARRGFSPDWFEILLTERDPRLKAIAGYLDKLEAIATKNGEKFLSDEDRIFSVRKSSLTAERETLKEIEKAQKWFGLSRQEKRANDRAVKRGDTLLADDSRKSLELAISYYGLSRHDSEKNVRKVKEKASRLGDAHLKKGEKKIAADYYQIAGLSDKASKIEEAHEAEKEKAEVKRQEKFKKDQKSLEKELGL